MNGFTLTEDAFVDYDDALSQIAARGWHAVTLEETGGDVDWHWHDVDAVLFFLGGALDIEMKDGTTFNCRPFARLDAPPEIVHRESSSGYRVVIGINVPVSELIQPINKPASDLPTRSHTSLPSPTTTMQTPAT